MTATGLDSPDLPSQDGFVLVNTKLRPPVVHERMIARPQLDAVLDSSSRARLCLVSAPAGFGKTALLSAWSTPDHPDRRVAWVSLDDGDNDPYRFWTYVTEALCRVDPGLARSLERHQTAGNEQLLLGVVLPSLLNALDAIDFDLVLVLDDVQVISDPVSHRTLEYVFDHLPPRVRLCLLTRVDPPLPLARLRARGELQEIRSADLAFTRQEAGDLLNRVMALDLAEPQVDRLWRLTEGWPAALYLAGLSIRSGSRTDGFIASFEHGHRHVLDFLGSEVLRQIPERVREFLTQTSILRRLSASLCDAVCMRTDSAALIADLENHNVFVVPLEGRREWYRYHHLFAALMRLELESCAPESVRELHRRAARWFEEAGDVEEAIHHAVEALDHDHATHLIINHWMSYERSGQVATVGRWLARMPDEAITVNPSLAVIAALVGAKLGASQTSVEQRLEAAEAVRANVPEVPGSFPVPFAIAFARAVNCFGDVGASLTAARQALAEVGGSYHGEWGVIAAVTLGRCLYLAGASEESRTVLTDALRHLPSASDQPFCAVNAWALLSLLADDAGEHEIAAEQARRAFDIAQSCGVRFDPLSGVAHLAIGRAARRAGHVAAARTLLTEAVTLFHPGSYAVQRGDALLELAIAHHASGEVELARASLERAREIIASCEDSGRLEARLTEVSVPVQRSSPPNHLNGNPLTHGETRVLRFLDTQLSQGEIAQELQISVNTVRTHIRAVYRKLGVTSRQEAVAVARSERSRSAR